jgi:steroid delta-isomerase-like uncharacterized protein
MSGSDVQGDEAHILHRRWRTRQFVAWRSQIRPAIRLRRHRSRRSARTSAAGVAQEREKPMSREGEEPMSREDNKILARRVIAAFNSGDVDAATAAEMFTEDVRYTIGNYPLISGRDQLVTFLQEIRRSFPDFTFTIEEVVAEGDSVAFRFVATGTHRGALQGIPPTNKQFQINGLTIARVIDGKVSELWEALDQLGQLQQLGLIPG